jgi:hypothetical protein
MLLREAALSSVPPTQLNLHQEPSEETLPSKLEGIYCSASFVASLSHLLVCFSHLYRNIIHGSDSVENAEKEIALWFAPAEVTGWTPSTRAWIYERL